MLRLIGLVGLSMFLGACGDDGAVSSSKTDAGAPPMDASATDATPDSSEVGPADAASELGEAGPTHASVGCISGAGLPEGENTFELEGKSRRFVLRLPNGYSGSQPWPVVLALHPNSAFADYWDGTDGGPLDIRSVLEDRAILVLAEAIDGKWRDYSQPASTWPARIESELLYFDTVLEQIRAELCIDERSVFSLGFSGGGSFSGVLACRRTDIRAMAVAGSVIYFDENDCVGKSAAWISIGEQEMSTGRQAFRDFFRDRNGCASTSIATPPPPCVQYDGCEMDTPVHYCEHPDGHIWPAFGSQAAWDFFSKFVDK